MPTEIRIALLLFITVLIFILGIVIGEENTKKNIMRDAFNNGVATKEIVGEKVVYRWIETHKHEP